MVVWLKEGPSRDSGSRIVAGRFSEGIDFMDSGRIAFENEGVRYEGGRF